MEKHLFFRGDPTSIDSQAGPFLGECTGVPQPLTPFVEYDEQGFGYWREVTEPPCFHVPVWGVCREPGKVDRKVALVELDYGGVETKTWWIYSGDPERRPISVYWWAPLQSPKMPATQSS